MELEYREDRDQGISKFIKLMRNLTQLLLEDSSHQLTIYSCLNSQQVASLFDSLHDQDHQLRITAAKFVCLLLQNNPRILELIGVLEGYHPSTALRKYAIGGLSSYQLNPQHLKRKCGIKQPEIVASMRETVYQAGVLAWAVEIKTGKVAYFGGSRSQLEEPFPFDPQHWIIGVFIGENEEEKRGRYKISRK